MLRFSSTVRSGSLVSAWGMTPILRRTASGLFGHVIAGHEGFSGSERYQRGHHADERALARAVGTQQTEDFPVGNREAHVLDRLKVAVAFDDVGHLDRRLLGALPPGGVVTGFIIASPACS